MRLITLLSLFALGTLLLPPGMASPAAGNDQHFSPSDTNVVFGPDAEEEEVEDDDLSSTLHSPRPALRRDTLATYTLDGRRATKVKPNTLLIYRGRKIWKR